MKELMLNVAMGAKDRKTLTSLANRIIRLNSQMTQKEKNEFQDIVGNSAGNVAQHLLDAFDDDVISNRAGVSLWEDKELEAEEKIKIEEMVHEGTATEIMKQFWARSFDPSEFANVENYLHFLQENFTRMTDLPCDLPQGSTEQRAKCMIMQLAKVGALELLED